MENLEQPNAESKANINYESENDLLDAIRKQAEEAKSALETGSEEGQVEEAKEVDDETSETANEDNNEPTADESFDIAEWLSKNPFKLKDRDLEIEVADVAEANQLMHMGLNYHRKTQELAPLRKIADYATQHNISIEDMQMLADLKSGNKEALAELAKRNSIDVFDVDTEADYKPSEKVAYREMSEADLVAQELAQDPVLYGKVRDALTYVPRSFAENIVSDARILSAFRDDVANGIADKVLPQAVKNQAIYGGDFIEHYVNVANQMFGNPQNQESVGSNQSVAPATNASPQTKAKAGAGSSSGAQAESIDLWENVSEEELLDRARRLASQMRG